MEEIKLINPGQQITRNSERHEEQLPTPSVKEEKAMTTQGMGAENKSKLQTVIKYVQVFTYVTHNTNIWNRWLKEMPFLHNNSNA